MPAVPGTSLELALIIHSLQGGGAERLMSQLASRWSRAGHTVHLVTLASADTDAYPLDARVVRHGLGLMSESGNKVAAVAANMTRVRRLRAVLRTIAPDFMLSFCDRMNIVAATAAYALGRPLWIAEHSDPRKQRLGWGWERWRNYAYRRSSGCIVLTDSIAAWMGARFPNLPLQVIPPAISSINFVQPPISRGRSKSPKKSMLFMGRLNAEKNVESLIIAWQKLEGRFQDWQLVLAGDGPEQAALRRLIRSLDLDHRVDVLGWVKEPWEVLNEADIFVLPSHYEGFPVALLEAMSFGKACLSTPSSESADRFAAAGGIALSASTDSGDLAHALERLLESPHRRAALGTAARQIAAEYEWSAIGPQWDSLLPIPP